jgi:hypothetical protein
MGLIESALTLLTGGGLGALGVWIRARARTAVAREETEQEREETRQTREAGAAEVVGELLGHLRGYHVEVATLRGELSQAEARCAQQLEDAEAACDDRTQAAVDAVRRDLLRISARVRTSLPADDTGRIELERIEERQRRASAPRLPAVRREPKTQRREGDDR